MTEPADGRSTEKHPEPGRRNSPAVRSARGRIRVPPANAALVCVSLVLAFLVLRAIAKLLFVFAGRLDYPFELEWMEGGSAQHVRRVLAGGPLYVEPGLHFIPYLYTPLYWWVCAPFAAALDNDFLACRLVTVLSVLAVAALLLWWMKRETGSLAGGLIATGVFAASFKATGAWFDLARVDGLYLALLLGGIYALKRSTAWPGTLAAAALIVLSFWTKQSAAAPALFLAVWLLAFDWRRGALFAVVTLAAGAALAVAQNWRSGGWFFFYIFAVPAGKARVGIGFLFSMVWKELIVPYWPSALLAVCALMALRRRPRREIAFWPVLLVGAAISSAALRRYGGSYLNSYYTVAAAFALLDGIAVAAALERLKVRPRPGAGFRFAPFGGPLAGLLAVTALVLAGVQFLLLNYNPAIYIPTREDRKAGERVRAFFREFDGDVLNAGRNYLSAWAGKSPIAHTMSIYDVLQAGGGESEKLKAEIEETIRSQRFALAVDKGGVALTPELERVFDENYHYWRMMFGKNGLFLPRCGVIARPDMLHLANRVPAPETDFDLPIE